MGLDQFAFVRASRPATPVDFDSAEDDTELHYWRKHPNLQGWMEKLYRRKGGKDESFNCVPVELTGEDLDALEMAVRGNELPETTGFFFGRSDGSEVEDDLKFIRKAREAIAEGKAVFYYSWW